MGIYIPGMEMPFTCWGCELGHIVNCAQWKNHTVEIVLDKKTKRHPDCPLVPVPPHGRLIEAKYVRDAIIQEWMDKADDSHMYKRGMEDAYEVIRNAPTIIPADPEKR